MARLPIVKQTSVGVYPASVTAEAADFTWTTLGAAFADGFSFATVAVWRLHGAMRGSRHVQDIQRCVLSIDVEEWFHILETSAAPSPGEWGRLPGRVEETLPRLLDVLERRQVQTTCFFVGWVARRYPQLVRMATRRGHEIASHGYR